MRRRAIALSILSSTAVLAVGYQVGVQANASDTITAAREGSAPQASNVPSPGASGASGTFIGAREQTRFGDVQVQITVENGTITDVIPLQLTDEDRKSVAISNRAAPVLRQEVLAAQSANVQNVSGATYTADGYLSSLQSALDQAGL